MKINRTLATTLTHRDRIKLFVKHFAALDVGRTLEKSVYPQPLAPSAQREASFAAAGPPTVWEAGGKEDAAIGEAFATATAFAQWPGGETRILDQAGPRSLLRAPTARRRFGSQHREPRQRQH